LVFSFHIRVWFVCGSVFIEFWCHSSPALTVEREFCCFIRSATLQHILCFVSCDQELVPRRGHVFIYAVAEKIENAPLENLWTPELRKQTNPKAERLAALGAGCLKLQFCSRAMRREI
jgi:hypothetical protein